MDIYESMNQITEYIEENITEKIDYKELSKIMGTNKNVMQSIFSLLIGISLAEYIRKRRLSLAGVDLYNGEKIIDVAVKYNYENATSFSRAFTSFHGIKPSMVKNNKVLKNLSRPIFHYNKQKIDSIEYKIITKENLVLYGFSVNTNNENIKKDAPNLFNKIKNKMSNQYGSPPYGMITYEKGTNREYCNAYWVLYNKEIPVEGIKKINIPKSNFLSFRIHSQEAKDIQEMANQFYDDFLPSCNYKIKEIPELEYYHDDIVDFLVPIE